MINNTIARRYAKALVQLGAEGGLVDRFREELAAVDRLFAANAELRAAFADPALTLEQKSAIMKELVAKAGCSELVGNFLLLLVDKNRIAFLGQIVQTYEKLADDFSGVIRPVITTAFPLEDGQVASIQGALEKKTGKKVVPQVAVDTSLLGGVVTQIGDIAYDNSVKTQLKRIQDILQKG
ncbi:ATP synthase F1 subunit delta [Geobacter sp. SVR]|uniref:ATP synthase F1 subunit delta n=1 Tax=Geobacter sp. SVR TaxID=2495594 RepID=UPI00143EF77A|nr:ATP synthase F1 subunit delta [Geobacter sp. SVR]BCS55581.1 ATP synthase subunit delta [Geobacter sp. SVR]GCF83584.1 ATP synthase subunit delta [Geobacter sp. SVR]